MAADTALSGKYNCTCISVGAAELRCQHELSRDKDDTGILIRVPVLPVCMPHIPFPQSRTLREKRTENIAGRECDVYIYDEEFSTRLIDPIDWLVRLWHGKEWQARHVRIEVPYKYDDYVRYVHDTRGRHWPRDLASVEEHVQDARDKARDIIESGKAEDITCH